LGQQKECDYYSYLGKQEECEYSSYLGYHLTIFSYFSMDQDVHHADDQFRNHFEHALKDDFIDNYIFLADHSHDALNLAIQLSYDLFYEEENVILDDQELFMKAQGGHLFISKGEFKQWKSSFLN